MIFSSRLVIAAPEGVVKKLQGILGSAQIEADEVCYCGQEALEALTDEQALLLTTVKLPDMTGAELAKQAGDAVIEEALKNMPEVSGMMFEAAQYYARTCRYDKALDLYERCYKAEEDEKPRFSDPLQGMAIIHEIRGDYASAVCAREREMDNLKNEWGYVDEAPVQETLREIQRLREKMN